MSLMNFFQPNRIVRACLSQWISMLRKKERHGSQLSDAECSFKNARDNFALLEAHNEPVVHDQQECTPFSSLELKKQSACL
jgi:hypothetical protein